MPLSPLTLSEEQLSLWDALLTRLLVLNERVWEWKIKGQVIENWLLNFTGLTGKSVDLERLHALFLLSQFMYYGSRETRVLLKALYRELFIIPLAQNIRSISV